MTGAAPGSAAVPAGYVALDPPPPGVVTAVCRAGAAELVRAAIARSGTLYAYAASHPRRRALRGRGTAYAVPLGDALGSTPGTAVGEARGGPLVVVRHGWRGGLLRRVRRDLFFPPTRAPAELAVSERLRAAGVATPAVVAYAVYRAPAGLRRVDVATELVPDGVDLAAVLAAEGGEEAAWVRPTAVLLAALARAGVRHPDLNLKNVLLAPARADRVGAAARAWVLDVDVARVLDATVGPAVTSAALAANLARLARSLRKWAAANRPDPAARARLGLALAALGDQARAAALA